MVFIVGDKDMPVKNVGIFFKIKDAKKRKRDSGIHMFLEDKHIA